MSRAAYPSRVAIAQALACLGGKAAEASNYRGPLAKVHELLSENPPKVESAAVAAAVGVEVTCPIQPEAPAERQAEAWLLAAVHELLTGTSTSSADSKPAAPSTNPPEPIERVPFFELAGRYQIAPDTKLEELAQDLESLFASGMGAIEADSAFESFSDAQWAGVYMLRQAGALAVEIARRTWPGNRAEGGAA